MDFIANYGLFLLKAITIVIAILFVVIGVASLRRRPLQNISITSLNKLYKDVKKQMQHEIREIKVKKEKKRNKKDKKPLLFVIDFIGDIKASRVETLRDEITAILAVATPRDEVVIRLESPGGTVNGYGLAAAQLQRFRDKNIPLTICIDKVAASGGYLMACVANQIIAAPFSIIGSIGVVAQLPNFNKFLKKHNIDFEMITAGEYKRTLTVFGENTDKDRQKFQEDIEVIHHRFRDYIMTHRAQVNIDEIATGEHWLATDAFNLKLVDKLMTSDDYLLEKMPSFAAYKIEIAAKQPMSAKLMKQVSRLTSPWA